ncbi:hypothetical protein LZ30DRAFT_404972 [Colletotrichum cereale]|nr:hypothetical protein LZ30DRAFT_404972 [Colletotrichum cereale]
MLTIGRLHGNQPSQPPLAGSASSRLSKKTHSKTTGRCVANGMARPKERHLKHALLLALRSDTNATQAPPPPRG